MAQTTVRVHDLVRDRLKELPSALQLEFGLKTDQIEVVAALVHGTTLGELAGMLLAFSRYSEAKAKGSVPDFLEPPPIT